MEMMSNFSGTIILDVDDVLFYTTSLWFHKIIEEKFEILAPYLNMNVFSFDFNDYSYDKYFLFNYNRKDYLFSDWLLKKDLTEEQKKFAIAEIFNCYENNFYLNPLLRETELTRTIRHLGKSRQMNIDKIVLVTRTTDNSKEDKLTLLKNTFNNIKNKVEIILVQPHEKKSEAIKEYENISIIIDDELRNVYDYIDNGENVKDCSILIPSYAYNCEYYNEDIHFDSNMEEKAKEKNIDVCYYH